MKRIITAFLALFIFTSLNLAQEQLRFEFDYARFNLDSTSVFMEFYYELSPKGMVIAKTDNGDLVEAIVQIEMKNLETEQFFINRKWKLQDLLDLNDSIRAIRTLAGVLGFAVPEGKYSLQITASDAKNPAYKKTINEAITIKAFSQEKYQISDIQLATNIKKDFTDPQSIFYKNTLEVIPNPSMFFSEKMPMLFFYAELYNLYLENPKSGFRFQKVLFNSAGTQVYKSEKKFQVGKKSLVEIGSINLMKYPTDTYNFEISLIDTTTNQAFVTSKRFYYYNSKVEAAPVNNVNSTVLASEFALMEMEECDKMFNHIKYIAAQREKDQYVRLDSVSAKREFLFNFWKGRDSNPSTPINEFKQEYMRRVEFANTNFSLMKKEGYLSDRGRVLLMYGEPDQRDYYTNETSTKPYETWFFNAIEGGVSFIFGDVTGFGNYELLHSTKRDEVRDENWMRRLSTD